MYFYGFCTYHNRAYLKDINFRSVIIFAPRKNAKITTRENSDAHLVCMHTKCQISDYIFEHVNRRENYFQWIPWSKNENNHQAKIET